MLGNSVQSHFNDLNSAIHGPRSLEELVKSAKTSSVSSALLDYLSNIWGIPKSPDDITKELNKKYSLIKDSVSMGISILYAIALQQFQLNPDSKTAPAEQFIEFFNDIIRGQNLAATAALQAELQRQMLFVGEQKLSIENNALLTSLFLTYENGFF